MFFDGEVIIGASAWSAGLVLNGCRKVLVVDRSATVGGEYFDAFRRPGPATRTFHTPAARKLAAELAARHAAGDFYAAAPLLYRELLPHAGQFRLWQELAGVRRLANGWAVDLAGVDGVFSIECAGVVDNTPECRSNPGFGGANIVRRRLRAAFLGSPAAAALPEGFSLAQGRAADEWLLTVTAPGGRSMPEMRKLLLDFWHARPAAWRDCRLAAIGRRCELAVREEYREFAPGYRYFHSGKFTDALEALDHQEVSECC